MKLFFYWISDHLTAIVAFFGFIATLASSLMNRRKINQVHIDLNGRLSALLKANSENERAKGVVEGRELSIVERQARTTESERVEDRNKG